MRIWDYQLVLIVIVPSSTATAAWVAVWPMLALGGGIDLDCVRRLALSDCAPALRALLGLQVPQQRVSGPDGQAAAEKSRDRRSKCRSPRSVPGPQPARPVGHQGYAAALPPCA